MDEPNDFRKFVSISVAVFGNLVILTALDESGDVWQYTHPDGAVSSYQFRVDGTWLRLGRGRMEAGE